MTGVENDPDPSKDTPNEEVARLALKFYGAERCGDGANWIIKDNAHGPKCHTDDGATLGGKDLSGGWHDAGDHIKFSLTVAYAAYTVLKGYDAYPKGYDDLYDARYGAPNGIPDVLDEVKYAVDYLAKILVDSNTLVSRIGDNADHDVWLTSPYQSTLGANKGGKNRPIATDGKADIAGLSAAALALMSRLYAPYDAALAATYLEKAKALFTFGKSHPGTYGDAFYANTSYEDDMLCGAAELYAATKSDTYLNDAKSYDKQDTQWPLCWSTTADLGRHTLVKAGANPASLAKWTSAVDSYVGKGTPAFFDSWGALRYSMGASFSAALLYDVTKNDKYRTFALGSLEFVKGTGSGGSRSFVVGWGQNPPQHPHHRNAFGYDPAPGSQDNADGWTPFNNNAAHKYVLSGALVGGPSSVNGSFTDNVQSYQSTEVTIDYNAGFAGTAAFAVAQER
ncbi:Endo-1,4-beta-glucanase [Minicystis rosea]|nr:Endo-1,4-beta-glucanase [Minicystis rosea]